MGERERWDRERDGIETRGEREGDEKERGDKRERGQEREQRESER